MTSLGNWALVTFATLLIINGATDGLVVEGALDLATDPEKADARASLACLLGLLIYPPTTTVDLYFFSFEMPMPRMDDVLIAGSVTGFLVMIHHFINKNKKGLGILGSIAIFVIVWFAIKLSGWYLIELAGPGCVDTMTAMAGMMSGLYQVGTLLGVGVFIKLVWSIKGSK